MNPENRLNFRGVHEYNGQQYQLCLLDLADLKVEAEELPLDFLLSEIAQANSEIGMCSLVTQFARAMEFDSIGYACILTRLDGPPLVCIYAPNVENLVEAVHSMGLLQFDETITHMLTSVLPMLWRFRESELRHGPADLVNLIKSAFASRILFPIHGPHQEIAGLWFNSKLPDIGTALGERLLEMMAKGSLLTTVMHEHVMNQVLLPVVGMPGGISRDVLEEPELAVLVLAAKGYESPAIGKAMQLTPRRVDYLFSRIMKKLQAANRTEAVVRAVDIGAIRPAQLNPIEMAKILARLKGRTRGAAQA